MRSCSRGHPLEIPGVDFLERSTGSGSRIECTRCKSLLNRRAEKCRRDTSDQAYEMEQAVLRSVRSMQLGHEEGDVRVRETGYTPSLTIYFWDMDRMRIFVEALADVRLGA